MLVVTACASAKVPFAANGSCSEIGAGVMVSAPLWSCDTLGFRIDGSSVMEVPGLSAVDGGDSGISLEESDLLNEANGLRCFFSAFRSKDPAVGPITLFRRFITVPSRLRPPRGVCRGTGSGPVTENNMSVCGFTGLDASPSW